MRQSIRIDGNMAFYAGDFLAGIVAFLLGGVGILNTLSVNDQKCGG